MSGFRWTRPFIGLTAGAVNFFSFILGFAYWYAGGSILGRPLPSRAPGALALMFGPAVLWLAYVIYRMARRDDVRRPAWKWLLHGFIYLASEPAGFFLAALVCSNI